MTPGPATTPALPGNGLGAWIEGGWAEVPADARIPVEDPSTEETIGDIPTCTSRAVDEAVAAATRAQPAWAATPVDERCATIERIADALEEAAPRVADLVAREVGMPHAQALAIQATLPVAVLRSSAAVARAFAFETTAPGARVLREPAGVVGAITPWNFPLHQIASKLGPALAAGCTVVLKPSEVAPFAALLLAELTGRAGLPPGVLGVVTGDGPVTGEALVAHPGVDVVSFTGSLRAGRRVGEIAGGRIARAALELGGKSASVVLDDADLERAVRDGITRGFLNSGQACNASTRILVPAERLKEAEEIAADAATGIVVGPAFDPASTMGPVVSGAQRERVLGFIQGALADGARAVRGGAERPAGLERGHFVAPTVFTDVDRASTLAQEEVFGPVLCLMGYDGDDDAVALANDTPYGLAAELWSGDADRARSVAARLRAGQVKIGGVRTRDTLEAPFGGMKLSGLGRELGPYGLEEFLETKAVLGG